jgi:hypothetical protein
LANLIQIKRSLNTATPVSLANGEFAVTANGDILFIGSNSVVVPIGGKRFPGVLTANQALVANSSNWIDALQTAKLIVGSVGTTINISSINATSNSSVLGSAANNELVTSWAIKNYVDTKVVVPSPGGSNTYVQFNDSGVLGGQFGFTFDKSANNLSVANVVAAGKISTVDVVASGNGTFNNINATANVNAVVFSGRDLTLTGNLTVSGTLTTIDATNLQVKDSMIKLSEQQTAADALSIGFYGAFGNSTVTQFSGLFRDQADSVFKLFSTQLEPTTTVSTANVTYATGTLAAYLKSGGPGLTAFIANSTVVNITANSTVSVALVANTLSLSTPLPGSSGGLGLGSFTLEDILVANSTNGFRKLGLGADGTILQISGSSLVYSTLDGGTF